jgi:hypothetical protein
VDKGKKDMQIKPSNVKISLESSPFPMRIFVIRNSSNVKRKKTKKVRDNKKGPIKLNARYLNKMGLMNLDKMSFPVLNYW